MNIQKKKNAMKDPSISIFTSLSLSIFLHLITISLVIADSPYTPSDIIFLDCGSSTDTSLYGQSWTGDIGSKFAPSQNNTSQISMATSPSSSVPPVPYLTARISHTQFTYKFPVSTGPKFIRLYFYPNSYSGLDRSKSFISVTVDNYTLLHNFSASLTADSLQTPFFSREFTINVVNQRFLNITFSATPNNSPDVYAFINGIEIISMPLNLFYYGSRDGYPLFLGQRTDFPIDNATALETIFRLNVGGSDISPSQDSGMFRKWSDDNNYISGMKGETPSNMTIEIRYQPLIPAYTAPDIVYKTARTMGTDTKTNMNYNLTWSFNLDSGFNYLFRLHFCEFQFEITNSFQRVFRIFIDYLMAEDQASVFAWSTGNGIPVYKDYVLMVPEGREGKQKVFLQLNPNDIKSEYKDAFLNGLEIFKLSNSKGSLAGINPLPSQNNPPPVFYPGKSDKPKKNWTPVIIAGALSGCFFTIFVLAFFIFRRIKTVKDSSTTTDGTSKWVTIVNSLVSSNTNNSPLPSELCRHFSIAEIKAATNNFHESRLIGVGGFGNVYRGYFAGDVTPVAIKRGNPTSQQGIREFQTEIEMLSKLRHRQLVSLIGYCEEDEEMILVYDYMANGTLRDHLYRSNKPPLSWNQRLEICIGAARGLHYLHAGAKHTIIHRDVKTTNILLDEKWVAKVSDFGLSKMGPTSVSHTHVSTVVKGSFGYLDPEYFRHQHLTEKSDVYSFGVVLFEVLTARPALDTKLEREKVCLAEWARVCCENGTLDQIIDPYLKGKIAPECLKKFAEIGCSCLADNGIERPTMNDVVWNLEFALQLQNNAMQGGPMGEYEEIATPATGSFATNTMASDNTMDSSSSGITVTTDGGGSLTSVDTDGVKSGTVFSQIWDMKGR